jgi:hypothetical protein
MSFNRSALIYVGNMMQSDPVLAPFALEFMRNLLSALPRGRPISLTWISPGRTYLHFECQCELDLWRSAIRTSSVVYRGPEPDPVIWSFSQMSRNPGTLVYLHADQRNKAVTVCKHLLRSTTAALGVGLSDVRIEINEESIFSVEAGIFFVAPEAAGSHFQDPFISLRGPGRGWDQNPPWAHTWTHSLIEQPGFPIYQAENDRLTEDDRIIREFRASLLPSHRPPVGPAGENEQG